MNIFFAHTNGGARPLGLVAGLLLGLAQAGLLAQTDPYIAAPPADQAANPGSNVTFRVRPGGTPPFHYQWLFNQTALANATNLVLTLTNLQPAQAGIYSVRVTNAVGAAPVASARLDLVSGFTVVTNNILGRASGALGAAWGDFNNDGWVDLFVSSTAGYLLYTNRGDGTFGKVAGNVLGGDASGGNAGAAWADLDNDGWLDLAVGNRGPMFIYRNLGNGQFERLTPAKFSSPQNLITFTPAWGDYDNDGFVDLFVPTATPNFSGSNDLLYHNKGDGSFSKVTNNIVVSDNAPGQSGIWGDYHNNGRLDLFATKVNGAINLLYVNEGGGKFTKANNVVALEGGASGGAVWADFDNDGYLDLYVGNFGANSYLYHNNGDGTFKKVTDSAAVRDGQSGGCVALDFDNDGWIDIVMPADKNYLYHNNGDGTFTKVTTGRLVSDPFPNWGGNNSFAAADVNHDGFQDLLLVDYGGNSQLYLNNGNSNNWLTVKCEGRVSNRAAIGAKVRVKARISGKDVWQLRQISGGGSVYAQSEMVAAFGLGNATQADVVRVEWPSGIVQDLTNVAPRQFLTIREPSKLKAQVSPGGGEFELSILGGRGVAYTVQSSPDLTDWTGIGLLTNQTGTVSWTNSTAPADPARFFRAREN